MAAACWSVGEPDARRGSEAAAWQRGCRDGSTVAHFPIDAGGGRRGGCVVVRCFFGRGDAKRKRACAQAAGVRAPRCRGRKKDREKEPCAAKERKIERKRPEERRRSEAGRAAWHAAATDPRVRCRKKRKKERTAKERQAGPARSGERSCTALPSALAPRSHERRAAVRRSRAISPRHRFKKGRTDLERRKGKHTPARSGERSCTAEP